MMTTNMPQEVHIKTWNEIVRELMVSLSSNSKRRFHGKHAVRRRQLMKFYKKKEKYGNKLRTL